MPSVFKLKHKVQIDITHFVVLFFIYLFKKKLVYNKYQHNENICIQTTFIIQFL